MDSSKTDNSLQDMYLRNMMLLGWVTVLFLLPFAVGACIRGHALSCCLLVLMVGVAMFNSFNIYYKKKDKLIPYTAFFVLKIITLTHLISHSDYIVLFWAYPFVFIIFFVQNRLRGRIMSAIFFVVILSQSIYMFESELVIRFALTLLMMIVFCDVLVGVLIKMETQLSAQAIRDPLTNAYNRRYMNTCLETTIEETKRNFGPACLVVLDVDYFKKINDNYGHSTGDAALVNLVDLLHRRKRKLDYVFRTGGEEFVLLLRNTSLSQAIQLAKALCENVKETQLIDEVTITISLGVAEYKSGETSDAWLKRADKNLYTAKDNGRDRVCPEETAV